MPQICNIDLQNIFESTQFTLSLPFAFFHSLIISWTAMLTDGNPIIQYQYGFPPDFITYTTMPFQLNANNQTYSCYRGSFMGLSPLTEPVFAIEPSPGNPVTTTVTATAYDSPPDCSGSSGCLFGNPVSVQSTATAQASVPEVNLLPQPGDAIFGIITSNGVGNPTTTVYDYPRGTALLAGPRQARQGMLTYLLQPIPNGFDITNQLQAFPTTIMMDKQLELDNGAFYFDHEQAAFTLDQTLVPLNNQEMCITPVGHVPQWLCELLANFQVSALTDMRNGKFVVRPDAWSEIVTLDINDGEILQRVYPGCPEVSFKTYSDGAMSYALTNSLQTPVTATVRVLTTGRTCQSPGDKVYTLQSKQTFELVVPTCGNMTIQVFQPKIPGPGLLACGPAFQMFNAPGAATNLPAATNLNNQTFVVDTFIQQVTSITLAAVGALNELAPVLSPVLTPNLTTLERQTIINNTLTSLIAAAETVVGQRQCHLHLRPIPAGPAIAGQPIQHAAIARQFLVVAIGRQTKQNRQGHRGTEGGRQCIV
jgi:hypothetical protein